MKFDQYIPTPGWKLFACLVDFKRRVRFQTIDIVAVGISGDNQTLLTLDAEETFATLEGYPIYSSELFGPSHEVEVGAELRDDMKFLALERFDAKHVQKHHHDAPVKSSAATEA